MDERLQFVGRRLAGGSMAELCREVGISRKTGYKVFERYQECGVQGLAFPGNDEVSSSVSWSLTWTARYPLDPPAIARHIGLGDWLVLEVRVSCLDRAPRSDRSRHGRGRCPCWGHRTRNPR
jgi:hypothetical protein